MPKPHKSCSNYFESLKNVSWFFDFFSFKEITFYSIKTKILHFN